MTITIQVKTNSSTCPITCKKHLQNDMVPRLVDLMEVKEGFHSFDISDTLDPNSKDGFSYLVTFYY